MVSKTLLRILFSFILLLSWSMGVSSLMEHAPAFLVSRSDTETWIFLIQTHHFPHQNLFLRSFPIKTYLQGVGALLILQVCNVNTTKL